MNCCKMRSSFPGWLKSSSELDSSCARRHACTTTLLFCQHVPKVLEREFKRGPQIAPLAFDVNVKINQSKPPGKQPVGFEANQSFNDGKGPGPQDHGLEKFLQIGHLLDVG